MRLFTPWRQLSQDLSIPLFVQAYLTIMDTEEGLVKKQMATHLQDLMLDAQLYGWEMTRTFHCVWLNQIEQGHCTWTDAEEKLKFHRDLVLHPASSSLCAPPTTRASDRLSAPPQPGPWARPGNTVTSPQQISSTTPRPARPTKPWMQHGVSTQTSSISALSTSLPSTGLSRIQRQSALKRGTTPSSPHHG